MPSNPSPHPTPNRLFHPPRQEEYANWYPEDVTFQPKLVAAQRPPSAASRAAAAAAAAAAPSGSRGAAPSNHSALVDRLYASYEKVGRPASGL
jgi:hypothetical protein